jgi:uncharacterized protein (UPF0303 family)
MSNPTQFRRESAFRLLAVDARPPVANVRNHSGHYCTDTLLARLLLQEELLQFTTFTNEVACEVGMRLIETAWREGKSVTVDVSRNGQQLFHYAMPGTSADNGAWIRRKNRVVNRFGHSSFYMAYRCDSDGMILCTI